MWEEQRKEEVMEEGEEELPRDPKIVKTLLESMGMMEYEPWVIHQFMDVWYRYVVDVLLDAQVYSEHAGKPAIDCDDVKLAIQVKVLLELARDRYSPLPKSISGPGIPLPPELDTLINPNYQLAIPKKQSYLSFEEMDKDEDGPNSQPNPSEEPKMDQQATTAIVILSSGKASSMILLTKGIILNKSLLNCVFRINSLIRIERQILVPSRVINHGACD